MSTNSYYISGSVKTWIAEQEQAGMLLLDLHMNMVCSDLRAGTYKYFSKAFDARRHVYLAIQLFEFSICFFYFNSSVSMWFLLSHTDGGRTFKILKLYYSWEGHCITVLQKYVTSLLRIVPAPKDSMLEPFATFQGETENAVEPNGYFQHNFGDALRYAGVRYPHVAVVSEFKIFFNDTRVWEFAWLDRKNETQCSCGLR